MRAGHPCSEVGRRRRAGSLCTQHAGETPALPGGVSRYAGWKPAHPGSVSRYAGWRPAYPGGASLYAGETPAHPACGRDACAPRRGLSLRQAGSPRTQHAGETPAHPDGAGVMGCIAVCGLEARVSRRCRGDGSYRCMRAGSPRTRHAGATLVHPGGDVL